MLLALALIAPAIAAYPTLFHLANRSKAEYVETQLALQALQQRETMTQKLADSKDDIDAALTEIPDLAAQLHEGDRAPREPRAAASFSWSSCPVETIQTRISVGVVS